MGETAIANRGLSEDEIGLIKGMLAAKMSAQDICGYMFRPGRSLNPAGVYEIKSGKFGSVIAAKSDGQVSDYIKNHPYFGEIATADRIAELRKEVRGMLRLQKDDARSYVEPKETERLEFKETFHLKSLPEYARSLIGYANNSGGFIIFGIKNDNTIVGLKTDSFKKIDPQKFTSFLKDTVQPAIVWRSFQFTFNELEIGCLYAEESENKPHITNKNASSVKANQIYYRYSGETAVIRPGELFAIIHERENDAIQHAISKLQQIVGIGVNDAEVVESGPSDATSGPETILIEKEVIKKSSLNDSDIIDDFIAGSLQAEASTYIEQAAHESVRWLPIYFFMKEGGLSREDVSALLDQSAVAKPAAKRHIKDRLNGKTEAFKSYIGAGERYCIKQLKEGNIPNDNSLSKARQLSNCLTGLSEIEPFEPPFLRAVLSQIVSDFAKHGQDSAIGSHMRRSAARVDELVYRAAVVEAGEDGSDSDASIA